MRSYEESYANFALDVPEHFNFTIDVVEGWAKRDPQRVALVVACPHGEKIESFTFTELSQMANQFGNALQKRGLAKGDRVLVMLPRTHDWYVALLAMFKLGILPVPTTTLCTPRDLAYRIDKATIAAVITDEENARKIDEIADQCPTLKHKFVLGSATGSWISFEESMARESQSLMVSNKTRHDDPMLLYFTSGTVAYPKMVVHTQASYGIGHLITARFWQDVHPEDMQWTITDTGWAKIAWGALFGQWTIGARIFVQNCLKYEPKTMLKLLESAGITIFCAPPTAYRILVQEELKKYDLKSLRHCISAGEPLNPEVIRIWEEGTGNKIYDGYGQTETVNVLANFRCMPIRPGSMGKPTPGFDVAVIDEDGEVCPANQEGHVAIRVKPHRPVGLFKEYWQEEQGTRDVFRGDWYLTGDKAYVDEDGYFWFVGRADDVIITSGYRIGPFEVESALVEHPAVMESAVVASPDDLRGEVVKAFVVLAPGYHGDHALVAELQKHVRQVTAPYKYPRVIEFVEDLPKTISGKIRRGELRKREWEGKRT